MSLSRSTFLAALALASLCAMPALGQIFPNTHRSSAAAGINNLAAPVPAPLLSGKKAFISFEMGDVTAFPSKYSGGPERAYNEFFAAMKAWGHYELVDDPAKADVVFAVRFVDPPEISKPQVRLGISDTKTHTALWGFVEQVDFAFLKKNRDSDFSDTVQLLMTDLKTLLANAPGPQTGPAAGPAAAAPAAAPAPQS